MIHKRKDCQMYYRHLNRGLIVASLGLMSQGCIGLVDEDLPDEEAESLALTGTEADDADDIKSPDAESEAAESEAIPRSASTFRTAAEAPAAIAGLTSGPSVPEPMSEAPTCHLFADIPYVVWDQRTFKWYYETWGGREGCVE